MGYMECFQNNVLSAKQQQKCTHIPMSQHRGLSEDCHSCTVRENKMLKVTPFFTFLFVASSSTIVIAITDTGCLFLHTQSFLHRSVIYILPSFLLLKYSVYMQPRAVVGDSLSRTGLGAVIYLCHLQEEGLNIHFEGCSNKPQHKRHYSKQRVNLGHWYLLNIKS